MSEDLYDELPSGSVVLAPLRCVCGSAKFSVKQEGPHIAAYCWVCRVKLPRWIKRSQLGLAPVSVRRDGIDPVTRSEVLARYGHRCAWCGVAATEWPLEMGHILPYAFMQKEAPDLADHPANLAPSCKLCNAAAHLVKDPDLSMLLRALVAYAAGAYAYERSGENSDNDSGPVRAPVRAPGLGSIPVPGRREAPPNGTRPLFGNDGRSDGKPTVA